MREAMSLRGSACPRPLQFELRHLVLAILFAAVYTSAQRIISQISNRDPAWPEIGVGAILAGAAWAITATLSYDKWLGRRRELAPTDWLTIVGGSILAGTILARVIDAVSVLKAETFIPALICCAYVLPMMSRRLHSGWKVFLMAGLWLQIVPILLAFKNWDWFSIDAMLPHGLPIRMMAMTIGCVFMLAVDWRAGIRPTWLQWFGVLVFVSQL